VPIGPVALVDVAVALPRTRVPGRRGAVATAQYDEDVVTLAASAALDLLGRHDLAPVALVLATTSAPFVEGGNAQVLAEVLGLSDTDLLVVEQGGSIAAGGGALATGIALAGTAGGPVLVVAADCRRDEAGRALGDAAVAFLLASVDAAEEPAVDETAAADEVVPAVEEESKPKKRKSSKKSRKAPAEEPAAPDAPAAE